MITAIANLPYMARRKLDEHAKRVPIAGRILPHLLRGLQDRAEAEDRTLSYMLEKAVAAFIDADDKPPPKPKPPKAAGSR